MTEIAELLMGWFLSHLPALKANMTEIGQSGDGVNINIRKDIRSGLMWGVYCSLRILLILRINNLKIYYSRLFTEKEK